MKINVKRIIFEDDTTIGVLRLNGKFQCFVLEDTEREEKIYSKTAIPKGTYNLKLTFSNRFQKILPEILDVPNFKGIRIHSGNTHADTEGCLLVGNIVLSNKMIGESKNAMDKLMLILRSTQGEMKIIIE